MLNLNNTQARVIGKFIEIYRDETNNVSDGITGHDFDKKTKLAKLFRKHREVFLDNYFIRITKIIHHFTRHDRFFQVTPLGVLAYLKWFTNSNLSEFQLDREFFPLLWKHWDKLNDIYGDILPDIVRKTLDRIEVKPIMSGKLNDTTISLSDLNESIMIPLGRIEVKIFRQYTSLIKQEINDRIKDGKEHTQSINKIIDDEISERFTFLFYFNLLNHGFDVGEMIDVLFPNRVAFFDLNQKLTDIIKEKKKSEIKEFESKMKRGANEVFSIIHRDKELHKLMKGTVSEIMNDLGNRKNLQVIFQKLG